jgi:hypothetical protein
MGLVLLPCNAAKTYYGTHFISILFVEGMLRFPLAMLNILAVCYVAISWGSQIPAPVIRLLQGPGKLHLLDRKKMGVGRYWHAMLGLK